MICDCRWLYRTVILIACGLYLAACALPATEWWRTPDSYSSDDPLKGEHYTVASGWECLVLGWMVVPEAVDHAAWGNLAWVANPLALIAAGLLIFRRPTGAAVFGVASFVVAAGFVIDPPGQPGHPNLVRVGAILWIASLLALAIAAMIRRSISQARKHAEPGRCT
jgi:hypothetical protein